MASCDVQWRKSGKRERKNERKREEREINQSSYSDQFQDLQTHIAIWILATISTIIINKIWDSVYQ